MGANFFTLPTQEWVSILELFWRPTIFPPCPSGIDQTGSSALIQRGGLNFCLALAELVFFQVIKSLFPSCFLPFDLGMVNSATPPFPFLCPNHQHSGLGEKPGAIPWVGLPQPHQSAPKPNSNPALKGPGWGRSWSSWTLGEPLNC